MVAWGKTHFGNLFLEKWTCIFWRNCTFLDIWALFQKWLPRPNHSAHIKGIEILCKTAVSMSRDVSSESKSIGANSKHSSPAGMSTWTFRICPFHIFFTLFSHYCETCYFFMLNTGWILQEYLWYSLEFCSRPASWLVVGLIFCVFGKPLLHAAIHICRYNLINMNSKYIFNTIPERSCAALMYNTVISNE